MIDNNHPLIIYGLRGLACFDVYGSPHDLHSGLYGGTVYNPAQWLAEMLASLHHPDGEVSIPGFYDDINPASDVERQAMQKFPFSLEIWQHETGLQYPWGESDYTLHERRALRPTLEINGMVSGYQGPGMKTIIPAAASTKLSARLVPNQDPIKIARLIADYVESQAPNGLDVRAQILDNKAWPVLTSIDTPAAQCAATAYERVWGVSPVFTRFGGSIPFAALIQKMLELPVLLMGFGLPDEHLHAPNEHLHLQNFYRGILTMTHFYQLLAETALHD